MVGDTLRALVASGRIDSMWRPGMLGLENQLRFDELTDEWEAINPDMGDPITILAILLYIRELAQCPQISTVYYTNRAVWTLSTPLQCINVAPQKTEVDLIRTALSEIAEMILTTSVDGP